jgi:Predicted P-loop-containing kinase
MEKDIILVSGTSGAGKSTAMSILEDMGYHCIDQFPKLLLIEFIKLVKNSQDNRYNHIALSTPIFDLLDMYKILQDEQVNFQLVYLDASDEQLLLRYKSTKHKHPLLLSGNAKTIEEAVDKEKKMFREMGQFKGIFIDTSNLNYTELKRRIENSFTIGNNGGLMISFVSFGYKYGIPQDADLLFDIRFLPNPYWDEKLRDLSGDDLVVYNYVMDKDETQQYLKKAISFMNYSFKQYEAEGRNHLIVGIGCTGGQHRSVSVVNYLNDYYQNTYQCYKVHRDKKDAR